MKAHAATVAHLSVGLCVAAARHAAAVQEDLEAGGDGAGARRQVHAVGVAVEALAEDHPVEGTVELDVDADAGLLALHLDVLDLGQVGLGGRPDVILLQQWRIYDGLFSSTGCLHSRWPVSCCWGTP